MHHIGVLAYGSLLTSPGPELDGLTARRIDGVLTPFPVEFARSSDGRGGAPTLVPVDQGGSTVMATVLVMKQAVSLSQTRNITYRREIDQVGNLNRVYKHREDPSPNKVQFPVLERFAGIEQVIYTLLADTIPVDERTAKRLAEAAIGSVAHADLGRDGISYLRDAISVGITTPLTEEYRSQILRLTGANTLDKAIEVASQRVDTLGR